MSVDFNSTPINNPTTKESETPMFAAVPAWERTKKRRGFGGGKSRSAAPSAASPVETEASDVAFAAAPAYATGAVKKNGGMVPLAIAAGIIAVGGLAAAGWYATQPHENGVAELTPGTASPVAAPAPPEMAANAVTPEATPAITPPEPAPAAAATPRTPTRLTAKAPARVRPAPASRSVEDAGVNASATLPSAPQPYSGPAAAPQDPTAPPVWNVPPAVTTQTPAPPVDATPAPVTPPAAATPPIQTPPPN